jgi:serine/threonine-protein kinase
MSGDDSGGPAPSVGRESGPEAPGAGDEVGDFELLEEIASGGMGLVFRARQKSLNRVVALKTIRPSALRPGDDAAQRFCIEAEAVARLDHPGIVPIFEMGELAGHPFLCLKMIEGDDLDRHHARYHNDPAAAARLMAEVARAVHYAHQRGVLHRDLKPSNIPIDVQGRPRVTDFGLARCLEDDSGITQTGLIVGTPSYMAPEQVSGPRNEVTTAADVYGLGAVLYAVLAGRPPFKGDSVYETLRQVREREPVSPRTWSPGVDRDLDANPHQLDPVLAVADRHGAGAVGPDEVALDQVIAPGAGIDAVGDPVAAVARDDVAGVGRCAADGVVVRSGGRRRTGRRWP